MIVDQVMENIQRLQYELQKVSSALEHEVISIMIDGSVIRGDFIEDSSDIDLTITTVNIEVDTRVRLYIEEIIYHVQSKLPKREFPRKPLIYDVQWQDIGTVKDCGQRLITEWNNDNVPLGYPKLWLYAFDNRENHMVIYGQDIVNHYTDIEPQYFASLRIERLLQSVQELKGSISEYDKEQGTITQIKNAWETIRCICISKGLLSIKKSDIYLFCKRNCANTKDTKIIEDLYSFYINEKNLKLFEGDYRRNLYEFTLKLLNEYRSERVGYR